MLLFLHIFPPSNGNTGIHLLCVDQKARSFGGRKRSMQPNFWVTAHVGVVLFHLVALIWRECISVLPLIKSHCILFILNSAMSEPGAESLLKKVRKLEGNRFCPNCNTEVRCRCAYYSTARCDSLDLLLAVAVITILPSSYRQLVTYWVGVWQHLCQVQHFCVRYVQNLSPGHLPPLQECEHVHVDPRRSERAHISAGMCLCVYYSQDTFLTYVFRLVELMYNRWMGG